MRVPGTSDLIPEEFRPSRTSRSRCGRACATCGRRGHQDEFVLDPSRITLSIGATGYRRRHLQARTADGPARRADQQDVAQHGAVHDEHRHHPQLGGVPDGGAGQDRPRTRRTGLRDESGRARPVRAAGPPADDRVRAAARLQRLPRRPSATTAGAEATTRGRRPARRSILSYNDDNCEYLSDEEIDEKLDAGHDVVSATFVTPYPPGFPVLVPGPGCSAGRSWRSSAIWIRPKSMAINQISGIAYTPRRRSRRVAPPSRSPPTGIG